MIEPVRTTTPWLLHGGMTRVGPPNPRQARWARNGRSRTTRFSRKHHLAPRGSAKSNLQHRAQLLSNLAQTPRRKSPTKVHGFWSSPLLAPPHREQGAGFASTAAGALAWRMNRKRPETGALPNFSRPIAQAAILVGRTSRSLPEVTMGIARGFIASGISRTRSTCSSPFSRVAPLT
jgi:hypothetical protein